MKRVVSIGASKEAALYFEKVLPNDLVIAKISTLPNLHDVTQASSPDLKDQELFAKVISSLIPGQDSAVSDMKILLWSSTIIFLIQAYINGDFPDEDNKLQGLIEGVSKETNFLFKEPITKQNGKLLCDHLNNVCNSFIKKLGFENSPSWVNHHYSEYFSDSDTKMEDNFVLAIKDLKLVDSDVLDWHHICEFRRDRDSINSFRRLRSFLSDNFEGKDPTYISDKLSVIIEDHDRAAKIWGFDTVRKSLSVAFTNDSVLMTSAGGLAAALAGAPLSIAAGASLLVPIAKVGLEFSQELIESTKEKTQNPVKYLTKLRDLKE